MIDKNASFFPPVTHVFLLQANKIDTRGTDSFEFVAVGLHSCLYNRPYLTSVDNKTHYNDLVCSTTKTKLNFFA